jgi:glutathione synthase/RimK-type ligase-like ATP-grasp enzyme
LPEWVDEQVKALMAELDLNFGSLDIVVTTDKRFVFLEVNPNGQYGAVSLTANANVDYEVAKFLMN